MMMPSAKKKILVIGQTPPPFGGQAMMTERMMKADLEGIELYLVRMSFSKSMNEVGKFNFRKIFHMVEVTLNAIKYKIKYKIPYLYYMPAGNDTVPLIRDMFILFFLRIFYSNVIFHFRAAGISEFVETRPSLMKKLAKWIYNKPNMAIHLAECNPDDGGYFDAKQVIVVPDGLEDAGENHQVIKKPDSKPLKILFVGIVKESKGVKVLVEAANILLKKGHEIEVIVMGGANNKEFLEEMQGFCAREGITDNINFTGVKINEEKWQYFKEADIFCFPSFFESESFGNVLVEAMMFELPLVSTQWRGIPSVVKEGENGLLVPIKDSAATADALETLIKDPELRARMGKRGREMFNEKFQLGTFINNLNQALLDA